MCVFFVCTSQESGGELQRAELRDAAGQQGGVILQRSSSQQENLVLHRHSLQSLNMSLQRHIMRPERSSPDHTPVNMLTDSPWGHGRSPVRTPGACAETERAGTAAWWALEHKPDPLQIKLTATMTHLNKSVYLSYYWVLQ